MQMPSRCFLAWSGPARAGEEPGGVDLTAFFSASGIFSGGAAEREKMIKRLLPAQVHVSNGLRSVGQIYFILS